MLNLPTHSLTRSLCWRYIQNIRGRFSFCHLDSRCKLRCTDSVYFAHVLFGSNLLLILSTRTSFSPLHLLYSQLIPFWIYLKFILVYLKFIFVIWHFLQWCLAEWKCLCDLVADGSTEHLTTVEVDGGTDQQMEDKSVVTQDFIMSLKLLFWSIIVRLVFTVLWPCWFGKRKDSDIRMGLVLRDQLRCHRPKGRVSGCHIFSAQRNGHS